ncbi:MAG: family 43 glycosylhydrolase [Defluviitaleaceae bacterium]|nr:family 43 glycosylhydrolase [Defluviitaleaceae bacterium]MCL2239240.1 family 43 glycosylhydrolase [Defluviitaleaceae bacterium]MCL2239806.1 family 43 glycosylhydrolase [Defluviitaleaceae bacterium]
MHKYLCNPLPLPYRYQVKKNNADGVDVFREAADPTLIRFKDRYYLFASMSGGFWYSTDLHTWDFKETLELPIFDYAPDVHEVNGKMVFSASRGEPCAFFASEDPVSGLFAYVETTFPFWDPALFADDDGRTYFYWGCGNEHPLWGVEVNPETFEPLGEKVAMLQAQHHRHGWERAGENNGGDTHPYIEGAFMNKYQGKYYLQYAAPGTEFNVYSDGVYVADKPLGPFAYQRHNPFSAKPGGFATGAGHGSTFQDTFGNYWHIATMRISVNELFERRLGLFPCDFDANGTLYCNQNFADYPFPLPQGKRTDINRTAPLWHLLSYNKAATASSHQAGHGPEQSTNEDIRTWWAADKTDTSPWYRLDLGSVCTVHAVQVNFADHQVNPTPEWDMYDEADSHGRVIYTSVVKSLYGKPKQIGELAYLLESSADGENWLTLRDLTSVPQDCPHDLVIPGQAVEARYIRISQLAQAVDGVAALSGVRVFGTGTGTPPAKVTAVTYSLSPEGLDMELRWPSLPEADGYNVRYGIAPEKLYNSWQVFGRNALTLSMLNAGTDYYVAVDSFNENGVTAGDVIHAKPQPL